LNGRATIGRLGRGRIARGARTYQNFKERKSKNGEPGAQTKKTIRVKKLSALAEPRGFPAERWRPARRRRQRSPQILRHAWGEWRIHSYFRGPRGRFPAYFAKPRDRLRSTGCRCGDIAPRGFRCRTHLGQPRKCTHRPNYAMRGAGNAALTPPQGAHRRSGGAIRAIAVKF